MGRKSAMKERRSVEAAKRNARILIKSLKRLRG